MNSVSNDSDSQPSFLEKSYRKQNTYSSEKLRINIRDSKSANRNKQRQSSFQAARVTDGSNLIISECTIEDIAKIASKIKIRSQVTSDLLKNLMNNIVSNKENVRLFLKVDGSLQALLRAFSGQNENFQLLAARCICNLALGSNSLVLQVIRASDSYILAHLSGRNCYIIEACLVALGNFSSHGAKHVTLLLNQGFYSKVCHLLIHSKSELIEAAALYSLAQSTYHGYDLLRTEDILYALKAVVPIFKKKSFLATFLLSVLSCHEESWEIMYVNNVHVEALNYFFTSLMNEDMDSVYYLRILSNCFCHENMVKSFTEEHWSLIKECFKLVVKSQQHLHKESLWLLGNIYNNRFHSCNDFVLQVLNSYLI